MCQFDGEEMFFENGTDLAAYPFEKNYLVNTITIENRSVLIILKEHLIPNIHSIGNESVSPNDWIKEYIKHYGKEPNLFDGA